MKKFHFSLDRVLRVKEINEDKKKDEFQRAQKYKDQIEKQLNELKQSKESIIKELNDTQKNPVQIQYLKTYHNYLSSLDEQITNQSYKLQIAEKELKHVRQEWIDAKQEKRVLEKLKERHYQEFRKESLKQEQKVLDEMTVQSVYSR
ncbi:flagellar export protein FliJ [Natranaerobius trueperi]|uniref:flagellar export protein FliJ n=1 Tax=Natranaerobius trueperi TaxID=759412 RepID=UPI0023E38FDE|nr:flagellar export protein FliJ [Natranaerobius trueperi]